MSAVLSIVSGATLIWLLLFGLVFFEDQHNVGLAAKFATALVVGLPLLAGLVGLSMWLIANGVRGLA